MKNKKVMAVVCAVVMGMGLLAGCGQKQAKTDASAGTVTAKEAGEADGDHVYKVAIIRHIDHPSLNQINDKIQETLEPLVQEGKVEIIDKNASGDQSMLPTIMSGLVKDKVDVLVPIATPTAQAAAAATTDIPIVFAAVSSPVEAGLVESFDKTDKNITGVSDKVSVKDIFALAKELSPQAKTFGFIYNTSEVNSTSAIERAKVYCDENGLKYKEATVTSTADVAQAAASLSDSVDAYFTPNDNTVASAMAAFVQVADKAKLPIYCGADSMVNDGGFATVGINYDILGEQVGKMVERIVNGQTIAENHVEEIAKFSKIVNGKKAKELGIALPEDKIAEFQIVE